jgi:quinol monooxygenase YgiN
MSQLSEAVSLHPYFLVQEGKVDAFVEAMHRFVARTANESACLYYDFTRAERQVFCREAYIGAEGVLAHLENVGDLIEEVLAYSELARIEVHGPASEIEKLREPLAGLNPTFFVRECGVPK